jgi:hypothetical protein
VPFCVKCSREISVGATFCPYCGTPATPVVTAPHVESALFTIEAYKGTFNPSRHLLFFTDRRLIVASVPGGSPGTSPSLLYNVLAGLAQKAGNEKIKQLREKEMEELLLDKKNYAIPYGEMTSIEVTTYRFGPSGWINIKRVAGTERFNAAIKKRIDDFERLLRPVLGDQLIVKR